MNDKSQKGAVMNSPMKTDFWIYHLVLVLDFTLTASVVGSIILLILGQPVPGVLLAVGTVAGAGLVKLLISPLNRELMR
jgi:hypothetical protein